MVNNFEQHMELNPRHQTGAGPTVAMRAVDAVPPSESCSSRVSLLSLYGMWLACCSASAAITFEPYITKYGDT